jgi:hypothetical protein
VKCALKEGPGEFGAIRNDLNAPNALLCTNNKHNHTISD